MRDLVTQLKTYLSPIALTASLLVVAGVVACNSKKSSGGGPVTSKPGADPTKEAPDDTQLTESSPTRIARRLALDIVGRLPTEDEYKKILAGEISLDELVDAYIAEPAAAASIGQRMSYVYGYYPNQRNLLTYFIDAADIGLPIGFAVENIAAIQRDIAYKFRWAIANDMTLDDLWRKNEAIMDATTAGFFSTTAVQSLWPDESLSFYSYDDGRPQLGFFSQQSLFTASSHILDDAKAAHATELLGRLFCHETVSANAHSYVEFSVSNIAAEVAAAKEQATPCLGCHQPMQDVASAIAGIGRTSTFSAWKSYDTQIEHGAGIFAQQDSADTAALLETIVTNRRLRSCFVSRSLREYLQMPLNQLEDSAALPQIYAKAAVDGITVSQWFKYFFKQPYYQQGARVRAMFSTTTAADGKVTTNWEKVANNQRLLNYFHWLGLADLWAVDKTSLSMQHELTAGSRQSDFHSLHFSDSTYAAAVYNLVQQLATKLIDHDLADGVAAKQRYLLTAMPDATFNTAANEVVQAQLALLWLRLTGESLKEDSTLPVELKALYDSGKNNDSSKEGARNAWKVVIAGIMLSPEFLSY